MDPKLVIPDIFLKHLTLAKAVMNTQNYLNLLHFLLILLTADHSKIVSSLTFNRAKRLSDANYDEESFRLAPYVVSIRTRSVHRYFGDNHFCSGVIVSPTFVLTSAHCLIKWVYFLK